MLPPTESKIEEDYDDLVAQAENLLYEKEFETAREILQKIPDNIPQAGYANLLKAVTFLENRSFNVIRSAERRQIEKHLVVARKKMKHKLIAFLLLAILEIDYYNYHGRISENEISPDTVSQRLNIEPLPNRHRFILKLIKPSDEARNKLGLS